MTRSRFFLLLFPLLILVRPSFCQYSLDFNGGTDNVLLNGTDFLPPWTMEVKVYKNETDNYQHLLTSDDGNSGIRLEQWYGNKVGFTLAGVADYTFNYSAPLAQWVHLAMVNDSTKTMLYVDGVLKGTINSSIPFPMKWISKANTEASLKARIDELRIWNTNLDQATIQAWMNLGIDSTHPDYPNLLHYYKFDEGSGNICHDSRGTLDGVITGATWYIQTTTDIGIIKLAQPERNPDNYSASEPLVLRIKNYGTDTVREDFNVAYTLDGGSAVTATVFASQTPMQPNETRDISFPPVNLNTSGTYHFVFVSQLPGDLNLNNDTLKTDLMSESNVLGAITNFEVDTTCFTITCNPDKVRVIFYGDDLFRIWLGPDGYFSNPAGNKIIPSLSYPSFSMTWSDEADYYKMKTGSVVLRAYKLPLRFALYKADNSTLVWEEASPLDYGNARTFQYLSHNPNEYFYGCGMQNGYFSHHNKKITIGLKIDNWDDGAVPNPVPFYMSTAGYGAFRNTFSPGEYDFTSAMGFSHDENRFDCFYFYGPSLKEILDGYTRLTGRSSLPPRWGLSLGDADCYNDNGQTTPDVITLVADNYRLYDLPGGWILPNDGYGCGYVKLDSVSQQLAERGFKTGLWTENGLANLAWEVGTAGVRAYKLDVAWVGSGYLTALNACKQAYEGIENNSNDRGFVWSVCGWAGTQRYSVIWSGDQAGNWEYIRFHIPTFIGAGLSGYNLASSDLDGIFGGSPQTYVRDMQWKTFVPVYYAMSGWAPQNKQPWVYGTTMTNINRKYLKLKMRLTPYLYTYCHEASVNGTPAVRAMVLEFPGDTVTWSKTTQYQFMCGEDFLVAPVYKNAVVRDSIYLPFAKWIDYWDGTVFQGPQFLNNYDAPLDKLPVFVKSGAIVPLYPEMLYDGEKPLDTLTLQAYPDGQSSFNLYEDDGHSKEYRQGSYAITTIQCDGPGYMQAGDVTVTIGPSSGDYSGKPSERAYRLEVHYPSSPDAVMVNGSSLDSVANPDSLEKAASGYCFDLSSQNGIVFIKTSYLSTGSSQVIAIKKSTGVNDHGKERMIRVSPNPTKGTVRIDYGGTGNWSVRVIDTTGKTVVPKQWIGSGKNSCVIDLKGSPGSYIIEIGTTEGKFTRTVEVIN